MIDFVQAFLDSDNETWQQAAECLDRHLRNAGANNLTTLYDVRGKGVPCGGGKQMDIFQIVAYLEPLMIAAEAGVAEGVKEAVALVKPRRSTKKTTPLEIEIAPGGEEVTDGPNS